MDTSDAVLAALGKLVLRQLPDGRFRCGAELPPWVAQLADGGLGPDAAVHLGDVFPFLDVFLGDAERAWAGSEQVPVSSNFWTETARDGEALHLRATALRVGAARLLVVTRDESLFAEQRLVLQRARELRLAHDELSREVEQRDVLVHSIVHDLASPLNAMLGVLSTLDLAALPGETAALVRVALGAAERQRGLIREILEVFAADRGATCAEYDAATADLRAAVAVIVASLEPAARARRVRLGVHDEARADVPCRVVGDDGRLQRVVSNLLENAVRHSPIGGSVRVTLRDDDGAAVRVDVDDDGPGVASDVVPRLFEMFARGRERAAGTGLGLHFCKITVERWRGAIGYERLGARGARFWFRLPRAGGGESAATVARGDGSAALARARAGGGA